MNTKRGSVTVCTILALWTVLGTVGPSAAAASTIVMSIGELSWLSGRWTGTAGSAKTEFICSKPERGQMMCMFRAYDDQKVLQLEFISLQETENGLQQHIHFKVGDFKDDSPSEVVLNVESASADSAVLVATDGSIRDTLTRHGANAFLAHIEVRGEKGNTNIIEAHWTRAE